MTPELSRRYALDRVTPGGSEALVEADAAERERVAARLMVPGVAALRCTWRLHALAGGTVEAEGLLTATVTQVCVVTLEPFEAAICEPFTVRFVPAGLEGAQDDPDEPDEIAYEGAAIDLGEAAVEQLALALDPFPRKPGAAMAEVDPGGEASAFAALAHLRPRD